MNTAGNEGQRQLSNQRHQLQRPDNNIITMLPPISGIQEFKIDTNLQR